MIDALSSQTRSTTWMPSKPYICAAQGLVYITKSPAAWTLNKESDIEAIFSEVGEIQQLDWEIFSGRVNRFRFWC